MSLPSLEAYPSRCRLQNCANKIMVAPPVRNLSPSSASPAPLVTSGLSTDKAGMCQEAMLFISLCTSPSTSSRRCDVCPELCRIWPAGPPHSTPRAPRETITCFPDINGDFVDIGGVAASITYSWYAHHNQSHSIHADICNKTCSRACVNMRMSVRSSALSCLRSPPASIRSATSIDKVF